LIGRRRVASSTFPAENNRLIEGLRGFDPLSLGTNASTTNTVCDDDAARARNPNTSKPADCVV
jgi:hypothetical protein